MNPLREAAQMALDALEHTNRTGDTQVLAMYCEEAITALRAALAEPEQEPVAWAVYDILHGGSKTLHWPEQHSPNGDPKQYKAVPLYTAPTPRKPLTEEEIALIVAECSASAYRHDDFSFARAIERAHGIGEQHE